VCVCVCVCVFFVIKPQSFVVQTNDVMMAIKKERRKMKIINEKHHLFRVYVCVCALCVKLELALFS